MTSRKKTFEPRLDILPPAQRRLWDELGATPPHFVLYGGTAIALRLGHRQSQDFDFFSTEEFSPAELRKSIGYLTGAEIVRSEQNTLTCRVNRGQPVQVSFFGGLDLSRVEDPDTPGKAGVAIASLLDLLGCKLAVLMERAAYKDYFDIDALLTAGMDLGRGLAAARAIYGAQFNPLISLKALTFYGEGDLHRLEPAARQRLAAACQTTDPRTLPALTGKKGLALR